MADLKKYWQKRKFKITPEPKGRVYKRSRSRFVVQEHLASHWHHDFRLEMEGVLKSWAVPKGVPEDVGVKRLAIQTEDHPVEYLNFEGKIPEGQYGAGIVKIWDKGKFRLLEKTKKTLKFELFGKRLRGEYNLIRFKNNSWLIFRSR